MSKELHTTVSEVPKQPLCPDLLEGIDVNRKVILAVYGIKGALVKTFLAKGFGQVQKMFPNVRFVGVDLTQTPVNISELNLPWHEASYMSASKIDEVFANDSNETVIDGTTVRIDGVIAAIPPNAHLKVAEKWLGRGVPVWVEKPFVLPSQIDEATELIKKYPENVFPVDFFLDSAPIRFLFENPSVLYSIGKLTRFDGRLVENWPLEKGREWLLDPKINGGGLGMDILVHPIALADRFLHAFGIKDRVEIEEVVRGRYVDEKGQQPPGKEETYMYFRGKAGDVEVIIDGGKGTDKYYYGVSLKGTDGIIDICTGTRTVDPYIHVIRKKQNQLYTFAGEGVGYGGTFFDFLLLLYGSKKSCFTELPERQRIGINSIQYMKEAYAQSSECIVYELGKEHPSVSVRPRGETFQQ